MERDVDVARAELARELRQRLESLQRAGVKDLPLVELPTSLVVKQASPPPAPPDEPSSHDRQAPSASSPPIRPPTDFEKPPAAVPAAPPPPERRPAAMPAPGLVSSLFEESGFASAPVPPEERPALLKALADEVAGCLKCPILSRSRNKTVFADGSPTARLMFIGEAPGADEDRTGVPFVGRAGQLLTDMITKGMLLRREDVYIANILKCRPPDNREPSIEESANCLPYLERQIEIIRPDFLCLLGRTAVQGILGTSLSMGRMRGKWYRHRGIPTIVTYHPSYLLRTPAAKKDAWVDLQLLMNAMGLAVPQRGKGKG